jgi:hypothetical protein
VIGANNLGHKEASLDFFAQRLRRLSQLSALPLKTAGKQNWALIQSAMPCPLWVKSRHHALKLPTTLRASESDGGLATKLTFERVIVWPSGHREIEGVTPKSLPAPSHALPNSGDSNTDPRDIKKLED